MMLSSAMPINNKPHLIYEGDRFSRLTVISFSHQDKRWRRHYLVRCDCGNEKTVQGTLLRSGNTRSCGCLSKEVKASARLSGDAGVINQIILQYKRHAKDRGIDWNLPRESVDNMVRMPCHYCGEVGVNLKKTKNHTGFRYNGIDRVKSSNWYEIGNVVPCCGICNMAKGTRSDIEFIEWTKKIAEQWGSSL